MKRYFVTVLVAVFLLGCGEGPLEGFGCEKIIAVREHSPKSILIQFVDNNGDIRELTTSFVNSFGCQNIDIYAKDFLPLYGGTYPFGKLDIQKYKAYRQKVREQG